MYFAILGKHPQISLAELNLVQPKFQPSLKKGIVLFDTDYPELLSKLGGCIKSGRVVKEKDLQTELQDVKIIGIQEEEIGKHFKKTIGIRRFKLVKVNHTDKEIKTKGKEIINLTNGFFGIVDYFQDIPLYETIDFDKPGRSMQMGMMPAKFTHILINLGLQNNTTQANIYDPFCGSGTTCFLANALGHDTQGSDINTKFAEQNAARRPTTAFATQKEIKIFTHDITTPISNTAPNTIIITEGWLGPIITKTSNKTDIQNAQQKVSSLYTQFIINIPQSVERVVFTIPWYIGQENILEGKLQQQAQKQGRKRSTIGEIYAREDQQIGRKICILQHPTN